MAWDYHVRTIEKSGPFARFQGENFAGQTFEFESAATYHETSVPGADGRAVRATAMIGMLSGPAGESACYVISLESVTHAGLIVLGTFADQTIGGDYCRMMWERGGRRHEAACEADDGLYTVCIDSARADYFACLERLESRHRIRLIACGVSALSCIGCAFSLPVPILAPVCVACVASVTCIGHTIFTFQQNIERATTEMDRLRAYCCNAARQRALGVPPGSPSTICTYACPGD